MYALSVATAVSVILYVYLDCFSLCVWILLCLPQYVSVYQSLSFCVAMTVVEEGFLVLLLCAMYTYINIHTELI